MSVPVVEIELTLVLDNWRRRHAIGRVNNLNAAMVVDLVVDSPVNCPISPLVPWRPGFGKATQSVAQH